MNDNQMKPLQALELIMTRLEPSKDNIEKAKVEYETVKSALKEYELMKNAKIIVPNKKISEDDFEKLRNQRMFVGDLEQCEIKPLFDEETKKKLKALEIIKNDTHILNDEGVERIVIPFYDNIYTPKEEYELLKEVLKNDWKTKSIIGIDPA